MEFKENFSFLSNFYEQPIEMDGMTFGSVEAAFQAAKSPIDQRSQFIGLKPDEAKKLGHQLPLRPDWEEVKEQIMFELLQKKFANQDLSIKLCKIRGFITEDNNWHDNEWGNCTCEKCKMIPGKNKLGKLLMKVRTIRRYQELDFQNYRMQPCDVAARKHIMKYAETVKQEMEHADSQMYYNFQRHSDQLMMELDSLQHLFVDGCGDQYIVMAQEIEKRGFHQVIDIGANTGYQSLYFQAHGIKMIGVDCCPMPCMIPADIPMYDFVYPIPLHDKIDFDRSKTVCVSSLCVGIFDPVRDMIAQIAKDFQCACIMTPMNTLPYMREFFTHIEKLDDDIYWMNN